MEKRRLPASGSPDQRDAFAGLDSETHILKRIRCGVAIAVGKPCHLNARAARRRNQICPLGRVLHPVPDLSLLLDTTERVPRRHCILVRGLNQMLDHAARSGTPSHPNKKHFVEQGAGSEEAFYSEANGYS